MKFISTRELRNRPGAVRELAQKEDLVLTADGKRGTRNSESITYASIIKVGNHGNSGNLSLRILADIQQHAYARQHHE